MLAVLMLMRPRPASIDLIADAVWGSEPPSTWHKQVQTAVARLRGSLGASAIVTQGHAYRLAVPVDAIDLEIFERAVARGREHRAAGAQERAIGELERALRLWREDPYGELDDWPPARAEIERLTALRLDAEDELIAARLDAGDHHAVAPDAARLASAEPLRERRWIVLATALYRCERQADALAALARARTLLVDELGLDPGQGLIDLEGRILRHDPSLAVGPTRPVADDRCPYKGLAAYDRADADHFFGREREVATALGSLDEKRAVVLAGPSGAGKSSIIHAGIEPVLRARGLAVIELRAGASVTLDSLDASPRTVVVADHLEALVSRATETAESRAIREAVVAHHQRGGLVVLAVRTDHLDASAADPTLGPLVRSCLQLVAPPDLPALRDAIEGPARFANLTLEHGLADVLLADAAGAESALPLLSHALAATWQRREGAVLTIDAYRASGGLQGAVARSAEDVYGRLDEDDRARCEMILRRLLTVTEPDALVSHPIELSRLADPDLERIVDQLVAARLLVTRAHHVALAHESLARAWPRLRAWVANDLDGQRVLERLSEAASAWDSLGRLDEDLARGPRLALAEDWASRIPSALTRVEADFLAASIAARELARDRERESEYRERTHRRRLRALRGGAVVAAASALGLSAVAWGLQREAGARGDEARAAAESELVSRLTDQIASLAETDRELAGLLAVELYDRFPADPRTQRALFAAASAHPDLLQAKVIHSDEASGGALLGNGRMLTVGGDRLATWSLGTLDVVTAETLPFAWRNDFAPTVRASADTRLVAVLGEVEDCFADVGCGRLSVFETATGRERAGLSIPVAMEYANASLAVAGDAVAVVDHLRRAVVLNDLATLDTRSAIPFVEGPAAVAALDQARFAVAASGSVSTIDASTGAETSRAAVAPGATGVALTALADGTVLTVGEQSIAALSPDGAILWIQPLDGASYGECSWIAGSSKLDQVFCGGRVGVITELRASTGERTGRTFDTQHGWVGDLAVVGTDLYALSAQDPVLSRWNTTGDGHVRRTIAPGNVVWDGYNSEGTRLLTAVRPAHADGPADFAEFDVWDVALDRLATPITGDLRAPVWLNDDTLGAYFPESGDLGYFSVTKQRRLPGADLGVVIDGMYRSGDGRTVRAVDFRGSVWTLDAETRARIAPTIRIGGYATRVVTSPDGHYVAISFFYDAGTRAVQIFDGRTGEALSPRTDDLDVAAVNDDGIVVAATGFSVSRFTSDLTLIGRGEGARGEITSIQFSRDGARYLVSAADQTNVVYDTASGTRLAGPIASAFALPAALRPDGDELAVSVSDAIELWSLDPAVLRGVACANAGRDLSQREWDQYLQLLGTWRATCALPPDPDPSRASS